LIVALFALAVAGSAWTHPAAAQAGPYTGLVIMLRGIRLDRSISPAVVTPAGDVVYGRGWWKPGQLDTEFAERFGIVEYVPSLANVTRVGPRPLMVEALSVSGPSLSLVRTDVVISDADALTIRQANRQSRFLQQMRVAFVSEWFNRWLRY
jgi:hypothetical protein